MARRATSGRMGLSHGSPGPLALMQWTHSRLHHVPVIWIQSVERRRKGARGASAGGAVQLITGRLIGPIMSRPGTGSICFAILRCERAGKPINSALASWLRLSARTATYTHVRLGLPPRSRVAVRAEGTARGE